MIFSSKTSVAGLITIIAALASAFLTRDFSGVGPALTAGLGLIAAADSGA